MFQNPGKSLVRYVKNIICISGLQSEFIEILHITVNFYTKFQLHKSHLFVFGRAERLNYYDCEKFLRRDSPCSVNSS